MSNYGYGPEPKLIDSTSTNYVGLLSAAFNWYNQEKDKKEARAYLKTYVLSKQDKITAKAIDSLPDSEINLTFGWLARMSMNGCKLSQEHTNRLEEYINQLANKKQTPAVREVKTQVQRPNIQDIMLEKSREYIGELEGVLDNMIAGDCDLDLYADLKAKSIPVPYCNHIKPWLGRKASEYVFVYETDDKEIKEAYSHISRRKLSQLIKTLSKWIDDLDRYSQFKKANRKPKVRKQKPAGLQVSKLKYKKSDDELGIVSVAPTDIIGSSQVWIYNSKTRKLAVYRSDSSTGIQVKGTSLQNYDPDMSEQKTIRDPAKTLKDLLSAGKIQLRKFLTEMKTKAAPVNGRMNEECLIIRVIK